MTRATFAVWTIGLGLVLGFVGMTMFYDASVLGLNYALFVGLLMGAVVGSGIYAGRMMTIRNMWPFIPALFFAAMVVIRADDWLQFYNVVGSLTLSALALHYMGIRTPFDLTSTGEQFSAAVTASARSLLDMPLMTIFAASHNFRGERGDDDNRHRTVAVVRGLVITVPILGLFAVLLGSADAVFANYLSGLDWIFTLNVDEAIGRIFVTGIFSWFAVGAITYGVARDWRAVDAESPDAAAKQDDEPPSEGGTTDLPDTPKKRHVPKIFRLSMIEGGMLLGSVNLLFGVFVLVQFVYLFGGLQNIGVDGLSYAEYARRGFFELVTVAVLTMALILWADRFIIREGKQENTLFRTLSIVVIALVGVMLLSAARRMMLYTDEFGLTKLRLWTSLFMGWLAVLFVVLVAGLFRLRTNIFSFGLVVVAIGFFVTLNLMNADARIAAHNINRALEGGEDLDHCYFTDLSADAVPVIVQAYRESGNEQLGVLLAQMEGLQASYESRADTRTEYNLGYARAGAALDTLVDDLDQYDPANSEYSCYRGYY
jgi:hypothetical protein